MPDYEVRSVRQPDGSVVEGLRFIKTIRLRGVVLARVASPPPGWVQCPAGAGGRR